MADILLQIMEYKRGVLAAAKLRVPAAELERQLAWHHRSRDFCRVAASAPPYGADCRSEAGLTLSGPDSSRLLCDAKSPRLMKRTEPPASAF